MRAIDGVRRRHHVERSRSTDARSRRTSVLSAIDIFVKDTSLVVEAAEAKSAHTPLAACAAEQFATAQSRGWGRRDDSTIIGLYTQAQWHSEIHHPTDPREREELTR